MNPTGKRFVSLFLVFSLMMLSVNLYAKERQGAKLMVTKKDGQHVEGELITVKPNSLLLLDTEGKDVSVDVVDIKIIRIVKKSKAWDAGDAGIGFLVGGGVGALIGAFGEYPGLMAIIYGLIGGGIGVIVGVGIGAGDKTYQIEGMSDSEIQKTMDRLRKKARVRNYK